MPVELVHCCFLVFDLTTMKLTIIRLTAFTDQDLIDLGKIWPEYPSESLELTEKHQIYAAQFNERLLGAVRITADNHQGTMDSLRIREITRRRGVGLYLVEEVLKSLPDIKHWQVSAAGVKNMAEMTAFMQALGFDVSENGWQKSL